MYKLIRNVLFLFPPERIHYFSMHVLKIICATAPGRFLIKSFFSPRVGRSCHVMGLTFRNPVGLAAGFDKNAAFLQAIDCLGFSHVEAGTVTPLPQSGNEKPRLFRLPKDRALINSMGFNNLGAQAVAENIRQWRARYPNSTMIVGGNIGKNKNTPNEEAWKDYVTCFEVLYPYVDYFTINVSSPNTPGLRALQDAEALRKIIREVMQVRRTKETSKPIFLKIAPDLTDEAALETVRMMQEEKADGVIISNTTISRENLRTPLAKIEEMGAGGLSGIPLKERAQQLLTTVARHTENSFCIIGSGGIFDKADAKNRMDSGAALIQVYTGFIYEGPCIVKKLLN
jgi:dihydroorotate dehydrogenase